MAEVRRLSLSGLTRGQKSEVFEGRVYSNGPMLEFDKGIYLMKCGDIFKVTRSGEVDNKQVTKHSFRDLHTIWKECSNSGLFTVPETEHLLGCLMLDYIVEVVGSNPTFWKLVTSKPELLQEFVDYIWPGIDMKSAITSVKPVYDSGDGSSDSDEFIFSLNLVSNNKILGELGFTEHNVQVILPSRMQVRQWCIEFPEYQKWKTPCLSFRKYLFLMWTHLWRQLAGACGIYGKNNKFEDVAKDPEMVHIYVSDDFYGNLIYGPDEIEEFFRENWLNKSIYNK